MLEKRALLIGNADYRAGVPRLEKTVADVEALENALEELGFTVRTETDLLERGMASAVREFKTELQPGDLAFFYYAGHGVEVGGRNYLIPVDIDSRSDKGDVPYDALAARRRTNRAVRAPWRQSRE